jgi:hypothetical protein
VPVPLCCRAPGHISGRIPAAKPRLLHPSMRPHRHEIEQGWYGE